MSCRRSSAVIIGEGGCEHPHSAAGDSAVGRAGAGRDRRDRFAFAPRHSRRRRKAGPMAQPGAGQRRLRMRTPPPQIALMIGHVGLASCYRYAAAEHATDDDDAPAGTTRMWLNGWYALELAPFPEAASTLAFPCAATIKMRKPRVGPGVQGGWTRIAGVHPAGALQLPVAGLLRPAQRGGAGQQPVGRRVGSERPGIRGLTRVRLRITTGDDHHAGDCLGAHLPRPEPRHRREWLEQFADAIAREDGTTSTIGSAAAPGDI